MKLWGGRFARPTHQKAEAFSASIQFDRRLSRYDVLGSIAHCRMLGRQQIIDREDAASIEAGLREVLSEIERGEFEPGEDPGIEDVHTAVEARLRSKIGDLAGKLHTARSRNDQVALDLRMYVRDAVGTTIEGLAGLQRTLLDLAESNADVIMPGYTHLQRAQPVLLAHHLLAYFEMIQRDVERFRACYQRADVLPLGSGALAGSPYPINREMVARELGFGSVSRNSLDAVSDRDFAVEYVAAAALAMAHLSRLAEEVVLWTTGEFGYLELDDAFATGSSIMPQKKNPDVAELVRAKSGRVYGDLMALLTVLKGLPLAYNRDLQEDKEALFDAADTLIGCLEVFAPMLATARFNAERLRMAAAEDFSLATDVADYLVHRGLPFRQAHDVVGRIVADCLRRGVTLTDLSVEDYQNFSPLFDQSILQLSVEMSVNARDIPGGTAPRRVCAALLEARNRWQANLSWVEDVRKENLDT